MSTARRIAVVMTVTAMVATAVAAQPCSVRPLERQTVARGWQPPRTGKIRVAMFDADSTLRVTRSGSPAANHARDVVLLPLVAQKLRQLADEGYLIAVLSNQGGIEKGFVSLATADGALRYTCQLVNRAGGPVHYYDFAEAYDEFRKPKAGMAFRLQRAVAKATGRAIDWPGSFMVGDSAWKTGVDVEPDGHPGEDVSNSDRGFAETVRAVLAGGRGMLFHHPRYFFGWDSYGVRNFHGLEQVEGFLTKHPELNPGVNRGLRLGR